MLPARGLLIGQGLELMSVGAQVVQVRGSSTHFRHGAEGGGIQVVDPSHPSQEGESSDYLEHP